MTINESAMLNETIKDKLRSIYQAMDKVSLPEKGDGICVVRSHGESPEVFEAIEKAGGTVEQI